MRELAKRFLAADHKEKHWAKDPTAKELLDYAYNGGMPWDKDRLEKIGEVMKKPISGLSLDEVYLYLTTIIGRDRICEGLYDRMIQNGTISSLLERYLVLTADEQ